jgi:Carboxypeptidase regulatory-like domain/TonB-dependent Receptor Plug Domain
MATMAARRLVHLGIVVSMVLLACPLFAQNAGSLRGTVTDTTGAVLPGVNVTLTNEATKFARTAVTDSKGAYFFSAVEPGSYSLSAAISGFKTRAFKGIKVNANDTRGLDVALEVGQQSETVTVTAERAIIRTETGAREGTITSEQIDNLSIISRSPMELLRILPGVVAPDQSTLESVSNGGGANQTNAYTVNGVRGSNNVITLDGSRMIDIGSNSGLIIAPNTDFVSEVKVQSSNYAAEFGSGGVQVSAITKGGGSEFHGTIYDYMRHYKLAANDRSNSIAGVKKPLSKYQYPGGNLSGPILIPGTDFNKNRDKAFFFFGIELWRQKVDTGSSFAVVPTLRQRQGFFDDYQGGQNLNQPTTVNIPSGFPGAGNPAPGNNLSPYIDPMGRKLMGLYPAPNYVDPKNRYNYVFNALQPQNTTQLTLRLDYNFSDSTRAYVRMAQDKGEVDQRRGLWWNSSDYDLPTSINNTQLGRSASLNVTSVLSPTITNEVLFTYSKLKLDNIHADENAISLAGLGIGGYHGFFGDQSPFVPMEIYSWGQGLGNLWDPSDQHNIFAYNSSLMFSDTFTKVLNTHAIKIGTSLERANKFQNFQNDATTAIVLGSGWIPGSTGSDFGDLLVGRPAQVNSGTALNPGNFQAWNLDGFIQDSWKVKKNFTLEYGLRFSKWTNNAEQGGLGAVFLPDTYVRNGPTFLDAQKTQVNGVGYASKGQVPKSLVADRSIFWMPRINFAWDIKGNGSTVLRGGGGLFYNRPMGNAEYDVIRIPPNGYNTSIDAYGGSGLSPNGFTYATVPLVNPLNQIGKVGVDSVNPNSINYPRTVTTSLSIAKRIPFQQVLDVGYVGTFGRHLLNRRQFNIIPDGTLLKGTIGNSDLSNPVNRVALDSSAVTAQRPFPALNYVRWWEYTSTSNYHSLQATLSRQTGKRFQYFVTYTFSKALGTSFANGEYDDVDPFDPRHRSYGVLAYDRTHIVNLSYNYQFPDLISKGGVLGSIVNGWQISGITSWASGVPISVGFQGDITSPGVAQAWWGTPDHVGYRVQNAVATGSSITPVFTCNPVLSGKNKVGNKILDVNCLGFPSFGQSGPFTSPQYIRMPSRSNWDLTLFKNFKLGEGNRKIQFRFGAFNIFNQAVPGTLGQDIDLRLDTRCNVHVNGVPNGIGGTVDNICDPTKGFSFTSQTLENFGKIVLQRGHRVVELALKLYF